MCISVYCTSTYSVLHGIVPRTLVHKGAALPLTEPWEIFPGNKCLAPAMRLRVFPSYPTQPSDENPDARPLSARDRRDKRETGLVTCRRVLSSCMYCTVCTLYVRCIANVSSVRTYIHTWWLWDVWTAMPCFCFASACCYCLLAALHALCIVHLDSFRRAAHPSSLPISSRPGHDLRAGAVR